MKIFGRNPKQEKSLDEGTFLLSVERLLLLTDIRKAQAAHRPTRQLRKRLNRVTAELAASEV